jgi:glycosyltransferase involved in cell wall biosynthesis
MNIVIDATNIGGGGGITHLRELLRDGNFPCPVKVIAQQKTLRQLNDHELLTKIGHQLLEKTLLHRVIFQLFVIDRYIPADAVVFAVTGDYLGKHHPVVSMSQNMLLYEKDFWKEMKQVREVSRFRLNSLKQRRSFKNSAGIIFISEYAKKYISGALDLTGKKMTVINHGLSGRFIREVKPQKPITEFNFSHPFRFIYVSTIHVYKNQWNVVEAIGILRQKGYPVELTLAGGVIFEPAGKKLELTIQRVDPAGEFIHHLRDVPYDEIDELYTSGDGIIFASSCENMPNILIESMASGVPIACSNKQPMPEFLKQHGFYFDARQVDSIVSALTDLLEFPWKREEHATNALKEVRRYSWTTCTADTFAFITDIHTSHRLKNEQG